VWVVLATALVAAQGQLSTPLGRGAAALAAVTTVGLAMVVYRALRTRGIVDAALDAQFGPDRRARAARRSAPAAARRWARILCWPFPWWFHVRIKRIRNLRYGPERVHRLDLYRARTQQAPGPVLVHFHGGAFRIGRKSLEARPLINRLAAHGWVCISANYRLGRHAQFPDHLLDAKQVIAWVREHAAEYGVDPAHIYIAGSSAGGHIAATAALTPNDARFQPGFEAVDTSVAGVVCLYPYPGEIATRGPASSPHDYISRAAPPFFIAHGANDTLVIREDVRAFVDHLRRVSAQPVVYAELVGGQHDFDLFHSIRFEAVIDGIEEFVVSAIGPARSAHRSSA
jgi:acetyl esterase/lipase